MQVGDTAFWRTTDNNRRTVRLPCTILRFNGEVAIIMVDGETEHRSVRLSKLEPALRKGMKPAEIRAWIAESLANATPEERAEYEQTGEDIREILKRIGMQDREDIRINAATADERAEPNDCPECARSFGPHYTGPCNH